jgi:resuscitation-promoting factor RpfA
VGIDSRTTAAAGFCALSVVAVLMPSPSALADPQNPGPPPTPPTNAPATQAAPPDGTPHLMSPQNLPPGTSTAPADPGESQGLTYLRELWQAVQTQNISGKDALLLLTQRPMDAGASPPPGVALGPQVSAPAEPPAAAGPPPAPPAGPPPAPPAGPPPAPAPALVLFPWLP